MRLSLSLIVFLLTLSSCAAAGRKPVARPELDGPRKFKVSVRKDGKEIRNFNQQLVQRITLRPAKLKQFTRPRLSLPFSVVPERSYSGEVLGLRVTKMYGRSGADSLGLLRGDLVTSIAGVYPTSAKDFRKLFSDLRKEQRSFVTVQRNGQPSKIFYYLGNSNS